jgi:hypothetical protein
LKPAISEKLARPHISKQAGHDVTHCNLSYMRAIGKRTAIKASPGKVCKTNLKNNLEKMGWKYDSSGKALT